MNIKESFLKRTKLVKGRAVNFRIDRVRLPNHKTALREYLFHPGAVGVVPLIDRTHVVMVRQYRHPVRQATWEIPAGKLDKGELALPCVRRELREETGYRARHFQKLLSFWPTAAFSNEVIHIFLATGLTPGPKQLDDDEFLTVKIWPLDKALRAIRTGKIQDSKTIIGLLALKSLSD